mmetsp:Transcript_5803/g.13434  ORF Transcript_5803/g.13434 Transcript_5803/m.13434 type:complete len:210 (-) Transcript_5803:97-726(-)
MEITYLTGERLRDPIFLNWMKQGEGRALRFDVKKCVTKGLTETVSPPEVFKNETTAFLKCAGSSALTSVAALDAAIERCVEVKHGIGGLYVYRGLFAAQLYHCFKSVPKNRMLVLDSGLLKSDPTVAMERIHAHLGLEPFDYVANLGTTTADLGRIFDKWYPSFEARTGWKIDGGYDPMPTEIRKHLAEFYKPFNEMLFGMVGETYQWQ